MDIIFVEPEETDQTVQMRRLRTFREDMCRHFTAEHLLATGATVLRTDIAVHHEVSGNILQLFTHHITDIVQRLVTFRAMVSVRLDNFFHPWKMSR